MNRFSHNEEARIDVGAKAFRFDNINNNCDERTYTIMNSHLKKPFH